MFLNYKVYCFSDFLCRVTLSDKQETIQKILNHPYFFLSKFWDEINYMFFYEFFDMFDTVNSRIIKTLRQNLSLVHITVLVVLCQLFTFETLWFNAYKFKFSRIQSFVLILLKDVNKNQMKS